MWRLVCRVFELVTSSGSGEALNSKQIKWMESMGSGKRFDERSLGKGGGKAE